MQPPTDYKWLPKAESEKPSSSNTSSRSTQYVPSRIGRVITRAVSTILPSSSNQHSNRATGNPPTCNQQYNSATRSTPASGLSSILSRSSQSGTVQPNLSSPEVALTSPDAVLYAHQLTLGVTKGAGATSSQAVDNHQSVRKEILPNPILRTNLLKTTPTFKDAGVTNPRVRSNYSRKPRFSSGASTTTDPALRNPVPTTNYSHKDRVTSRTGPTSQTTPLSQNSLVAVAGVASSQVIGNSKLVNFTSDQSHSQNNVRKVSGNKPLVKVTTSDLKGKGVATVENQAAKRKILDIKSAYKSYEQWIKDHYISCSDQDLLDFAPIPLGEKCQLCAIDLAFLSYTTSPATSTDPPVCAILPCGYASHASCLDQVYGSSAEPHCLSCASSPLESSKEN